MGEKYKKIEALMVAEGLTREEVISYLQSKAEVNSSEELSIVNSEFPADDVRSQTKLHWYAFEGGKFSPDSKAYPNCQGVVGWINPDPNAPEGKRIYVVLPKQKKLSYYFSVDGIGVDGLFDGRANTQKLIEYGKEHDIRFPAAEYTYNYCENGVKQGEAFLPAIEQLKRVSVFFNYFRLKKALKKINGTFGLLTLSSTECICGVTWGNSTNTPPDVKGKVIGVLGLFSFLGVYCRIFSGFRKDISVSCFLAY